MSDTAAVAADTASDAPICGSFSDSGVFSLGNSTSTSPSQNAMRRRKNILIRVFPRCGLSSQAILFVTGLDKSQVLPISLNREKSLRKPTGSIRRKFSIDSAPSDAQMGCVGIYDFETITEAGFETRDSPFASNAASGE